MEVKKIQASGIIIFRKEKDKPTQFLLMQHADRWDLPKGHVDPGESLLETAQREVLEETGITPTSYVLNHNFSYQETYFPTYPNVKEGELEKTLTIYLAILKEECCNPEIHLTEHQAYQWFNWNPPHTIQKETIDPLLYKIFKTDLFKNQ